MDIYNNLGTRDIKIVTQNYDKDIIDYILVMFSWLQTKREREREAH